jgi:predicted small lipoprotein YifL
MRKALAAIAIATVLASSAGCGGKWYRPVLGTEADFQADVADCKYEVALHQQPTQTGYYRGAGANIGAGLAAGLNDGIVWNNLMTLCIEKKGWKKQ